MKTRGIPVLPATFLTEQYMRRLYIILYFETNFIIVTESASVV